MKNGLTLLTVSSILSLKGVSVMGCNPFGTVQLIDANWQHAVLDCLKIHTSVDLILTAHDEQASEHMNGDHPSGFRHVAVLCDQMKRVGNDLVDIMTTTSAKTDTHTNGSKLSTTSPSLSMKVEPLVARELKGEQERVALCAMAPSSKQFAEGFSVEEIDYITTGGSLTGYDLSLIISSNTSNGTLTVATADHELPQGEYFVRSYQLQVSEGNSTDEQFCMNMGMTMVMYMRGFRASTRTSDKLLPCLNYYFPTWVLGDRGHFNGAIVYSFLLALLTQCLSAVRAVVVRRVTTKRTRKIFLVIIYTVQQFMGYLIMLIAMMYSVELLFAVVGGVALGNRIFVKGDPPDLRRRRQRANNALREPLLESTTEMQ